ncbi:hypothetical protein GCM10009810_20650 [Nostocoides vanveenii]|jgi:hypothetical protein|uniref:Uncharacterized protein n=1 Tax=Nostocoides vanveenii TaxID=330835 RepID=A0ABN2KNK2_9MICO
MSPRRFLAGAVLAASAVVLPAGVAAADPPPPPSQAATPAPCTGVPPQAGNGRCVRPDIWEWTVEGQ